MTATEPWDAVPIIESLKGRTITDVSWWGDDGGEGSGFTMELDDGRSIEVAGWGHDWWGTDVSVTPDPAAASSGGVTT